MTTERDVRDALASISDDYGVRGRLHDVPPHAVYEVTVDGRRAICKLARGPEADPATEARVLQFVGEATRVPVPDVLAAGPDFFVAEWRSGLPDDPTVDADRARAMGEGLATLHEETAGAFESTGFPVADAGGGFALDARETWHGTVHDLLADHRDYLADVGYDDVAGEALAVLRDRPELLAGAGCPVLAHGNYLPDHVGVADGEITCVVDFEHALVAPGEYDYWRTALPAFRASGRASDACRTAFRDGYESVRPLPDGFDRREDVYAMINSVSYLRALHVQRQQTGQERARNARAFREYVLRTASELREATIE